MPCFDFDHNGIKTVGFGASTATALKLSFSAHSNNVFIVFQNRITVNVATSVHAEVKHSEFNCPVRKLPFTVFLSNAAKKSLQCGSTLAEENNFLKEDCCHRQLHRLIFESGKLDKEKLPQPDPNCKVFCFEHRFKRSVKGLAQIVGDIAIVKRTKLSRVPDNVDERTCDHSQWFGMKVLKELEFVQVDKKPEKKSAQSKSP